MKKTYLIDFFYHPDGLGVKDLSLYGSWDDDGHFCSDWSGQGTPMVALEDGSLRGVVKLHAEPGQEFFWGVKDESMQWMLFEQQAQAFVPSEAKPQHFRLGLRHLLGLHPTGDDGFRAAVWAPNAAKVSLLVLSDQGQSRWTMSSDGEYWQLTSPRGWSSLEGQPYGFLLTTSCGQEVLRADPYARVRQGPQRGVSDLFVTESGTPTHRYNQDERLFTCFASRPSLRNANA